MHVRFVTTVRESILFSVDGIIVHREDPIFSYFSNRQLISFQLKPIRMSIINRIPAHVPSHQNVSNPGFPLGYRDEFHVLGFP